MNTPLLEKALAKISALPPERQDALAAILLDEIASESRWDEQFAKSQDLLAALADAALAEDASGDSQPLEDIVP